MKLLTIDGNSVLNRAFYGIKLLTTKEGVYTNGIYGFLSILLKVLEETAPDRVAVTFDKKGPTFRHKQFDGYKAGRKGMPPELAEQLPVLKQLLADLGYAVVECEGYEADDILGTLSRACQQQGGQCVIATGDRDALQLVTDQVQVRLATTKMGRPESTLYDVAAIVEKYTVLPEQLIDVKALMGDSSDNIPGVAGIGEKTAVSIIAGYGSIENAYAHVDEIRPPRAQKALAAKNVAEQDITLGVRPNHIQLGGGANAMTATMDVSEMMGGEVHLHANANGRDVVIIVPTTELTGDHRDDFARGAKISFSFSGSTCHVFGADDRNLEL